MIKKVIAITIILALFITGCIMISDLFASDPIFVEGSEYDIKAFINDVDLELLLPDDKNTQTYTLAYKSKVDPDIWVCIIEDIQKDGVKFKIIDKCKTTHTKLKEITDKKYSEHINGIYEEVPSDAVKLK